MHGDNLNYLSATQWIQLVLCIPVRKEPEELFAILCFLGQANL